MKTQSNQKTHSNGPESKPKVTVRPQPQEDAQPSLVHNTYKKTIRHLKRLFQQETRIVEGLTRDQVKADIIAFHQGELISLHMQANKEAGHNAVAKQIAVGCGLNQVQTVYDRLHLYRGAINLGNIQSMKYPRKYFMTLGSAIGGFNDPFSVLLHGHLLVSPCLDDEGVPDWVKVGEAGKLLKHTRKVVMTEFGFDLSTITLSKGDPASGKPSTVSFGDKPNVNSIGIMRQVRELYENICALMGTPDYLGITVHDAKIGDTLPAELQLGPTQLPNTADGIIYRRRAQQQMRSALKNGQDVPDSDIANRLHQGRAQDVLLNKGEFPEESVDLIVVDPPYSKEFYDHSWKEHTTVEHHACDTAREQAQEFADTMKLILDRKIVKDRFGMYAFVPMSLVPAFASPLLQVMEESGRKYIYQTLVWDKGDGPRVGNGAHYTHQLEAILYISSGRMLNVRKDGRKVSFPSPLFQCPVPKNGMWKPVELLKQLIEASTYTNDGSEVVLDFNAGRGSTGVACIETGRDYRLIESHPAQFGICTANIKGALGKKKGDTTNNAPIAKESVKAA